MNLFSLAPFLRGEGRGEGRLHIARSAAPRYFVAMSIELTPEQQKWLEAEVAAT